MAAYEIISSLLLLATLVVLIVYTWKTATIARAAIEQSEAAQKPCVVLASTAFVGREGVWRERPAINWEELSHDVLTITNIGNGPAMKVDFDFMDAPPHAHPKRERPLQYLGVGDVGSTGCHPPAVGLVRFRITYESMSGTGYETRVNVVDGRSVASFDFRQRPRD
jgi:hypothetical protein